MSISKQELRQDGFADGMTRAAAWVQKNFMVVLIAIFALAAVIVGTVWVKQSRESSQVQASQMLFRASGAYKTGQAGTALELLDELRARYGGTREGRYAIYFQGASHLALGENDAALERFSDYLDADGSGLYADAARMGKGLALEARGDLDAAAAEFRAVRQSSPEEGSLHSQAAFAEARVRQALGQLEQAAELLRPLAASADFAVRQEAETQLRVVEALQASRGS